MVTYYAFATLDDLNSIFVEGEPLPMDTEVYGKFEAELYKSRMESGTYLLKVTAPKCYFERYTERGGGPKGLRTSRDISSKYIEEV